MDVMKLKPYRFDERDFAHLDEEAQDAVKRIVFRVNFQQAVMKLRDKHRITKPVKFDRTKLPPDIRAMRGHPENRDGHEAHRPEDWLDMTHCESNDDFDADVRQSISELCKENDALWPRLLYCYTKFWLLPPVDAMPRVSQINDQRAKTLLSTMGIAVPNDLKELEALYEKADAMIAEGKPAAAREILEHNEWIFVHHDTIKAQSNHGNIVITIKPAADAEVIRKVIAATKPYRTYFRKTKYGKRDVRLEVYSMAADLHRAGVPPAKICSELLDTYSYHTDTVALPKLIERATKELGF